MATTTFTTAVADAPATVAAKPVKTGFFRRLVTAMQESRQRQAEIEIRRMRALIGDQRMDFQDALLPFKGE